MLEFIVLVKNGGHSVNLCCNSLFWRCCLALVVKNGGQKVNICWYSLFRSCDFALAAKNGGKNVREQQKFTLWEDVNTEKVAYDPLQALLGSCERKEIGIWPTVISPEWWCECEKPWTFTLEVPAHPHSQWISRKKFDHSPIFGKWSRPTFSHAAVPFCLLCRSRYNMKKVRLSLLTLWTLETRSPWFSMFVLIRNGLCLVGGCSFSR